MFGSDSIKEENDKHLAIIKELYSKDFTVKKTNPFLTSNPESAHSTEQRIGTISIPSGKFVTIKERIVPRLSPGVYELLSWPPNLEGKYYP